MNAREIDKLVQCLESVRSRPAMYLGTVTVDSAVIWLDGFRTAVQLVDGAVGDHDTRRQVLAERGWSMTARHPYHQMIERGMTVEEVIDELLVIEAEVLSQKRDDFGHAAAENGSPRLVEAYRAADLTEAHAIRIALEEAGFHVVIDGNDLQGAEQLGWATAPRILALESQRMAIREFIAAGHARGLADDVDAQDESLCCLACGEHMETADKCAACGWTYAETADV